MTPSEIALWRALRANRFRGLRFRRQHPFGRYILDFYCDRARLAVEVDGGVHQHEEQMMRDAARDAWAARQGVRTLRLPARLVLENIDAALGLIGAELGWRGPGHPFGSISAALSDPAPPGHLSLRERKVRGQTREPIV